jgi:hypothetical protein
MSFIGDAIGGILGTDKQADAAQNAANTQAQSANYAADLQKQAFDKLQQALSPYTSIGTGILPALLTQLGYSGAFDGSGNLTGVSPSATGLGALGKFNFNPTQQQLEQTPGYQFTLQQGMKGVDNAMSAKGLGLSGAQAKGLADYTTGLASNTFQQQYQNALQNYQTNYNAQQQQVGNLLNLLGIGQNAAAGVGNAGMQSAQGIGNTLMSGANATAAGQIAAGNAQSNALSGALNLGLGGAGIYALLSDARAKRDIRLIGCTEGGNKIYRYRYKGKPEWHVGVMAQEVEKIDPDAVINFGDTKYVDYSKVH